MPGDLVLLEVIAILDYQQLKERRGAKLAELYTVRRSYLDANPHVEASAGPGSVEAVVTIPAQKKTAGPRRYRRSPPGRRFDAA